MHTLTFIDYRHSLTGGCCGSPAEERRSEGDAESLRHAGSQLGLYTILFLPIVYGV